MTSHLLQLLLTPSSSRFYSTHRTKHSFRNGAFSSFHISSLTSSGNSRACRGRRRRSSLAVGRPIYGEGGVSTSSSILTATQENEAYTEVLEDPDPQVLEYVSQIKRVLELLKKNRDMMFSEVKLTIMIEDPRDVERRRLLGIDEDEAPSREDLASALEEINEGKIPKDHLALQMLAEELTSWPNLENEATKKQRPDRSVYARATDTGVDLKVAAVKRLTLDWDSAAEIEGADEEGDNTEVPPVVGFGALYLVTAFPVIIGVSVVLILFYNSLQ
ncbi:unnamed protein product [Cuscuta epithymum]|uniref:Ycf3-interacting protein 1, chloroplastic n=1 Tax=Cuscuta epithymum TaxID=186058 RepID=A0AAV0ECY7_9ASTE|nr:unnamed protein product [Cuscuta epithymum]